MFHFAYTKFMWSFKLLSVSHCHPSFFKLSFAKFTFRQREMGASPSVPDKTIHEFTVKVLFFSLILYVGVVCELWKRWRIKILLIFSQVLILMVLSRTAKVRMSTSVSTKGKSCLLLMSLPNGENLLILLSFL